MHFDFHTSPGIENILGNFDAEGFAQQLSTAHIEYINMAARCNMGFSYYNTKVGKKYPGLDSRDAFGEILSACHKRNIGVTAYFNIGLCHELAADNPGWLKVRKDGRVYLDNKFDNFFRVMCFNSPYREHFLQEIREICEYDIDGIFCDCFRNDPCYCPSCMADMASRGIDTKDDSAVRDYQNTVRMEFANEVKQAMGEKLGKIKLYFNVLPMLGDNHTHSELECLPSGFWGFDYFNHMAAYTRTKFEDLLYMSGRFQDEWGDFGGIKPLASMQNDLYDAMMNSFGISYGDHLHPVDGFENEVALRVGKVMEEKMLYEPYTDNSKNIVELGVLITPSHNEFGIYSPSLKGIARMLKELKLTYNVYDEEGFFEEARLLIIGEDMGFSDKLGARLKRYVRNGGKVLFAGSATDIGNKAGLLDYIEEPKPDSNDNAYFISDGSNMRYAMYRPSRVIKNINGCERAKYVEPLLNFTWDGRQAAFYRPQGKVTEYSAAVSGENTACICFDIFGAYIESSLVEQRDLVERLIRDILPERLIEASELPKSTTVSLTQNEAGTVLHIKATYPELKNSRGIIEEHAYIKSAELSIKGEYEVYRLPERIPVDCCIRDGRTVFKSGDILGYRAFLLK